MSDTPAPSRAPLRITTAGSVDDGKSTLIGRLLLDSGALHDDQLDDLRSAGSDDLDLARVTDGLEAEREQGITIDVAYRYANTPTRRLIIADAPGHEQYTRNLVTAASQADAAVILVDASRVGDKGLKPQTRRHAAVAALMGMPAVFAVNKLDLVGWSAAKFAEVEALVERMARTLDLDVRAIIPAAAKAGANIVQRKPLDWYAGPTLVEALDDLEPRPPSTAARAVVQRMVRWADGTRGYQVVLAAGDLRTGDAISLFPSGVSAVVSALASFDGALEVARTGDAVVVQLDRDVDVGRGDILLTGAAEPATAVIADLCWVDAAPYVAGRVYTLQQGTARVSARISEVLHHHDGLEEPALVEPGQALGLNALCRVRLQTQRPILVDPFERNASTGGFLLIDPTSHHTMAAGMLRGPAAA
jgi:sulfate adenylyltransferase subunit 1